MSFSQPPESHPRRSAPGPQSHSAARPRRALIEEPIDEDADLTPSQKSDGFVEPGSASTSPFALGAFPSDSIDNYKPKKHIGILILIVVVIAAIITAGVLINNRPRNTAPSAPVSSLPVIATPPLRTGGADFSSPTSSGYWKITNTQWSTTGVRLTVEITVDSGTLYYDFHAATSDQQSVDPVWSAPADLKPGFIGPGETVVGTIGFDVPRQDMTLVMMGRNQVQLSTLPVKG